MKYVVLQNLNTGRLEFRIGLLVDHDLLAAPLITLGYVLRSAGYLRFLENERFETFGRSENLNIGTHPDDARMLSAFYSATLKTAPAAEEAQRACSLDAMRTGEPCESCQ